MKVPPRENVSAGALSLCKEYSLRGNFCKRVFFAGESLYSETFCAGKGKKGGLWKGQQMIEFVIALTQ